MNVKKIGCLAWFGWISTCWAGGIPVADPLAVAEMVKNAAAQANQAMEQLKATKSQIEQAKSQFDALKAATQGNSGLGSQFIDPAITSYLPKSSWKEVYATGDLSRLRAQYGIKSDNPKDLKEFDDLLAQANTLEKAYVASTGRQKSIEQLAAKLNTTKTPQEREDLANRLHYEQLQLQNEQARLDRVQRLMDIQEKAKQKQAAQEFGRKLREMK
jgi:type IV secretion system protein VirB5